MTNHTFRVITQQARPYQGFPYVNPAFTDAPSIPPADPAPPDTSAPTRPIALEQNSTQTSTPRAISQAERELRERYGQSSRPKETTVNETIFYDPFEDRRIDHPKDSPSAESRAKFESQARNDLSDEDSDSDSDSPYPIPPIYTQHRSAESGNAGPSTPRGDSSEATPYYTKESGLYGGSADVLPAIIPMDQFPEPPPAYTETDQTAPPPTPVTVQPPPRVNVITTPTPTVGQEPAALYHPSRKYVTCRYCHQNVLTIVKKEPANSIGCFSGVSCAYCPAYFQEERHYCPNCDLPAET